jgi:hypothetical protein
MRPDDAFWAARLVSRFGDDAIRAVVAKARYSEPGAASHVERTLIARRDKVLRAWLTGINPVTAPTLDAGGALTFENAAVAAGVATPPDGYELTWSRFDNATGEAVGEPVQVSSSGPPSAAPAVVLSNSEFVQVRVRTAHPDHPAWRLPVTIVFRREAAGWRAVGLDREVPPEGLRGIY